MLTVREAAEALGVSRMTIYRRIESGDLEAVYDYKNTAHIKWEQIEKILKDLREQGWK